MKKPFFSDTTQLKTSNPVYNPDDLQELSPGDYSPGDTYCFTRIETAADFRDAVFFALTHRNIVFRPVIGSLSGFMSAPCSVAVIRYGRDYSQDIQTTRRAWVIEATCNPLSIANVVYELLTTKKRCRELVIDFTGIQNAEYDMETVRSFAVRLELFAQYLVTRPSMPLTATDIVALMGIITMGTDIQAAVAVDYGSVEWGWLMQYKHSHDDPEKKLDFIAGGAGDQIVRKLFCAVEPSRDDLDRVFSTALLGDRRGFGIVNVKACRKRFGDAFDGVSVGNELLLPNHSVAPSGICRNGDFKTAMLIGAATYNRTLEIGIPRYNVVSDIFRQQLEYHRSIGVELQKHSVVDALHYHCNYGAVKAADHSETMRPKLVSFSRERFSGSAVEQLDKYIAGLETVDHNISTTIEFGDFEYPQIVDWLKKNWASVIAVDFCPKGTDG